MKASVKLQKKVQQYCVKERKKRKNLQYNYGTVCVGVEDSNQNFLKCSHSFKNDSHYSYLPDLDLRLSSIGLIGKYQIGHCILGYCAEPHAANLLLMALNTSFSKPIVQNCGKFVFSKALRVRTHQEVEPCLMCKQTFSQL